MCRWQNNSLSLSQTNQSNGNNLSLLGRHFVPLNFSKEQLYPQFPCLSRRLSSIDTRFSVYLRLSQTHGRNKNWCLHSVCTVEVGSITTTTLHDSIDQHNQPNEIINTFEQKISFQNFHQKTDTERCLYGANALPRLLSL